jgi:hypothetical protein
MNAPRFCWVAGARLSNCWQLNAADAQGLRSEVSETAFSEPAFVTLELNLAPAVEAIEKDSSDYAKNCEMLL